MAVVICFHILYLGSFVNLGSYVVQTLKSISNFSSDVDKIYHPNEENPVVSGTHFTQDATQAAKANVAAAAAWLSAQGSQVLVRQERNCQCLGSRWTVLKGGSLLQMVVMTWIQAILSTKMAFTDRKNWSNITQIQADHQFPCTENNLRVRLYRWHLLRSG